jgi:hypothetical protein
MLVLLEFVAILLGSASLELNFIWWSGALDHDRDFQKQGLQILPMIFLKTQTVP